MDHKQWDNHQTQALLLRYVIDNIFGAEMNIINWTNWDNDGVEGFKKTKKRSRQSRL